MSAANETEKDRGISTIREYLEELRRNRPSVRLAEGRSSKAGQTIAGVLKAARTVFIREGHAGLSLRKVADGADVAVGNINYYFATKRDLLEAMLCEELADFVEAHIRQFEADRDPPIEILLNIVTFYVSNGRESYRFFYQIWGFAGSNDEARDFIRSLYRPIGRFVYYMVKASRPDLSDGRVRQIVLQIFSLEEGLKLFMGMGPEDDSALHTAERDIRELTRRLVEAQ